MERGCEISPSFDPIGLGRRIRHHRRSARITLESLAKTVSASPSHLSLIETGQREPRLALLTKIAKALGVTVDVLMTDTPVDRRTELTIELEHAQRSHTFLSSGIPKVRFGPTIPIDVMESMAGLHRELERRSSVTAATPEEARRANATLRVKMRKRNNYFKEIEHEAGRLLKELDYRGGPLGERGVDQLVQHLGYELVYVNDLPHSTRSLTDLKNMRIYLPDSGWGGHDPRTIILQTFGHQILGHTPPASFSDFLKQRVEVNYFAAALLIPETSAVQLLKRAKEGKYIAIEDLRDAFAVSYETAAHRFTNLVTEHLGIQVDFVKVHESGTIYKAYENDGFAFPADPLGSIEGQLACRHSGARRVFSQSSTGMSYWQYLDTPNGTYWSTTQSEETSAGPFSVSVGVPFADSKWFRGRETTERTKSTCPDSRCCNEAPLDLSERWRDMVWPSARAHSHLLAALPPGTFPGVDTTEIYQFLESKEDPSSVH